MKMKHNDFRALEAAIASIPFSETFDGMHDNYRKAGLSDRRFRFDCLYSIPAVNRHAWFDRGIYEYLDDDHIHTALKKIVG